MSRSLPWWHGPEEDVFDAPTQLLVSSGARSDARSAGEITQILEITVDPPTVQNWRGGLRDCDLIPLGFESMQRPLRDRAPRRRRRWLPRLAVVAFAGIALSLIGLWWLV